MSGRLAIIVKEFSSAPDEKDKVLDMFNQHAHHRNHKLGSQVQWNNFNIEILVQSGTLKANQRNMIIPFSGYMGIWQNYQLNL